MLGILDITNFCHYHWRVCLGRKRSTQGFVICLKKSTSYPYSPQIAQTSPHSRILSLSRFYLHLQYQRWDLPCCSLKSVQRRVEHYTDQLEDSLSRPKFETGIYKKRTRQPLKYQVKVRTGSFRFIIVQCTLSLEIRLAVKDRPELLANQTSNLTYLYSFKSKALSNLLPA